jgi:hypothetical protein
MLRFDTDGRTLAPLKETNLKEAQILERTDLQAAIVQSWEAFCAELGIEDLHFIGEEVLPHDSCADRIDILAMEGGGRPVVIELKRHRNKLQLLQAISYAAMVSGWDAPRFRRALGATSAEADIAELLADDNLQLDTPRVVLIAEGFEPEVILAADWLSGFGVDIAAYAINLVRHGGETLMSIDQRFPLLGLADTYEARSKRPRSPRGGEQPTWEEVVPKLSFPFAQQAVDTFTRHKPGDPGRRRFTSMYSQSFAGRMLVNLRRKYINVYNYDQSDETEAEIRKVMGATFEIATWGSDSTMRSGYSFKLQTEEEFDRFLRGVGEAQP